MKRAGGTKAPPGSRRGRKAIGDTEALAQMADLLERGHASTRWEAAGIIAARMQGHHSFAATRARLDRKYDQNSIALEAAARPSGATLLTDLSTFTTAERFDMAMAQAARVKSAPQREALVHSLHWLASMMTRTATAVAEGKLGERAATEMVLSNVRIWQARR